MLEVLLTPTEAIVSVRIFHRMHEYDCSMPTAPSIGRYWKRTIRYGHPEAGWLLAVVEPGPSGADYNLVRWRRLWVA